MRQGFIKVAAGSPDIRVADCAFNAGAVIALMERAVKAGASVLTLPELCLTGYTAGDLFFMDTLLDAAQAALNEVIRASTDMLVAVGLPVRMCGGLYDCAAVVCSGRLLGVAAKRYPSSYGACDELRHFLPAPEGTHTIRLCGQDVPFGAGLVFRHEELGAFAVGVEIGGDACAPSPPSIELAAKGAVIILNPCASAETAGMDANRRLMLKAHSARLNCAYVYAGAGYGESTTDMVFSGHCLIAENGVQLAQAKPFEADSPLICTEVDVSRLAHERRVNAAFPKATQHIPFCLPVRETALTREMTRLPFVPNLSKHHRERLDHILNIQAHGLRKRLAHIGCKTAVIGLSGGLDSTLALIACVNAMERSRLSAKNVLAVTMPCFGTTERTRGNAETLADALGVPLRHIDITEAVKLHLTDIDHPSGRYDTTYENAQARERTQVLMDIANQTGGIVIGTGDLSELALGFATYNGDHMSMYAVNASIPKTLLRQLVAHCADTCGNEALKAVLYDILDTPVSPELLPARDGETDQKTEDIVGPYELHDFFLYHFLRYGASPEKVLRLALYAFHGAYDDATIRKWLSIFLRRFFQQQYKRSCMPDGPTVGPVSLSPRAGWRMPSDVSAALWELGLD